MNNHRSGLVLPSIAKRPTIDDNNDKKPGKAQIENNDNTNQNITHQDSQHDESSDLVQLNQPNQLNQQKPNNRFRVKVQSQNQLQNQPQVITQQVVNPIRTNDNLIINYSVNPTSEIVFENNINWLPIHLVRKAKGKVWSHFWANNPNLELVRCKHCKIIIRNQPYIESLDKSKNSNNANDSNNTYSVTHFDKELHKICQKHLKLIHNINSLTSYYPKNSIIKLNNNNSSTTNSKNSSTSNATELINNDSDSPIVTTLTPNSTHRNESVNFNKSFNNDISKNDGTTNVTDITSATHTAKSTANKSNKNSISVTSSKQTRINKKTTKNKNNSNTTGNTPNNFLVDNIQSNNNTNIVNRNSGTDSITISMDINDIKRLNEREFFFPTTNLLSIIIASENLSFDIIKDSSFRLLLSRLSDSYIPNINSINNSIIMIANQITEIINRTAYRNSSDSQLIINLPQILSNPITSKGSRNNNPILTTIQNNIRQNSLLDVLQKYLLQLNNITLFSMSHCNYNDISLISLNFYDNLRKRLTFLPVSTTRLDKNNNYTDLYGPLRSQLLKVFESMNNLNNSNISITMNNDTINSMSNVDDLFHNFDNKFVNSKNYYHTCLVDLLSSCVKQMFGTIDDTNIFGQHNYQSRSKPINFYSNDKAEQLLDFAVKITENDINWDKDSIFMKINNVFDEIKKNPWLLERFKKLYEDEVLANESKRNNGNKNKGGDTADHSNKTSSSKLLISLDKEFYSTVEGSLSAVLTARPILSVLNHHLQCVPLTDADFTLIKDMLSLFKTINGLILYFSTTKKLNFIYVIFTILNLEKYLNDLLSDYNVPEMFQPYERLLIEIKNIKKILINDKMNLLALFCCPAALFDKRILEYIFKTNKLNQIVNSVTSTVVENLRKVIDLKVINSMLDNEVNSFGANDENRGDFDSELDSDSVSETESDSTSANTRSSTVSSSILNSSSRNQGLITNSNSHIKPNDVVDDESVSVVGNAVDNLLTKLVQEELYDYLSTVNTIVPIAYKSYCDEVGYAYENGRFKKIIQNDNLRVNDDGIVLAEQLGDSSFDNGVDNGDDLDVEFLDYDDNSANNNNEFEIKINQIEQLMNIHIPVCNAFWDRYLHNGAGVIVKFLIKLMFTESTSSVRQEYLFLNDFVPKLGEEYLDSVVKIKLFNQQFSAGKVDYEMDTLQTAAQYN